MWSNKKSEKDLLLKRLFKNKKYYSEETLQILTGEILDDLELDTKEQNMKFESYIEFLINQKQMDLITIKNCILSSVNSEYLNKLHSF